MRPEQFSHRIGNIDDELVRQSEGLPNFGRIHRNHRVRRLVLIAAIIALMTCSFVVGAFAFAQEPKTTYIEKEQEIIPIGDSGISLILPEEWAGKYGYDVDGKNISVYQLATHEKSGDWGGAGYLFFIDCIEGVYPMDYVYPMPGYTIATTATHTYLLARASDVQYDPSDEAVAAEYDEMSRSINEIQILLSDWMAQNSVNETNWVTGTVYIHFMDDGGVADSVICDVDVSRRIGEIIRSQDYSLEWESLYPDLWIMFDGEEYCMNLAEKSITNAIRQENRAILSEEDFQEFIELVNSMK